MTTATAVRHSITVAAPQERAFTTFTQGFNQWWPRSHKIGGAELAEAVLEGREGGRWYERDVDGTECDWGKVLVWEPPARLVPGLADQRRADRGDARDVRRAERLAWNPRVVRAGALTAARRGRLGETSRRPRPRAARTGRLLPRRPT
jgi:uncharacterized protein YndB with AHSA1/START domain